MDLASFIGIISGLSLIFSAILLGGESYNFINIPGLMIVFGGTLATTLITFQFRDVFAAFKAAYFVFSKEKEDPNQAVATMIRLSRISRRQGLLALANVKTRSSFLKKACGLLADGSSEEVIRAALATEIQSLQMRHFIVQDVFRKMGIYAPAFGMLGTLIGLVQMLSNLQDPTNIGPAMATALLTTFYGSFLSTLFFLPVAGKLRSRTVAEIINLEIMMEGATSIINNNNPVIIYEKLSSFISSRLRKPLEQMDIKGTAMKDTGYNSGFITYDDEATWLVTYADLMTLLLVFFVLLYSLAFFEKNEYESTLADVNRVARQHPEFQGLMDTIGKPDFLDKQIRIEDLTGLRTRDTALYSAINHMVQKAPGAEHLSLDARNGKLILTVSGETLFNSGSANLNPSAVPVIDRMIDLFLDYPEYTISIKGHTDDNPIATREFPSNWELSAVRATTVLRHLISRGIDPKRLTATGYGDIIPLVPNTSEESRARNRRVEFVLEKKTKPEFSDDLPDLDDQRASFRYVFKKKHRPIVTFKGQPVQVYDISAGGIAFEDQGFSQYDADEVTLDLEMPNFYGNPVLIARVRILHTTADRICHSIFEDCSVDEYEMVHKYVLEMQKRDLSRG